MTAEAPTQLPDQPTIAELQRYVEYKVEERGLTAESHDYFIALVEEVGELAKALRSVRGLKLADDSAAQNIEHEAADVLWLLVCVCNSLGIDLAAAVHSKERKNASRNWKRR